MNGCVSRLRGSHVGDVDLSNIAVAVLNPNGLCAGNRTRQFI
jgi:hypothetical protein